MKHQDRETLVPRLAASRWSWAPWHWSDPDKCLLGASVVVPFVGLFTGWGLFVKSHPDVAPYASPAFIGTVVTVWVGLLVGWFGVAIAALVLRRRAMKCPVLTHVTAQLYAVGFTLTSYWLGHYTASYNGSVLLGGLLLGFLLLDRKPMLFAFTTGTIILLGTTVAEQLQWLPYAPLLAKAPFAGGRLSTSWLLSFAAFAQLVFYVATGIGYRVCYRLKEAEEDLARATELISRYVAIQVAERIVAGDWSGMSRLDRRRLTLFVSNIVGFTETADRVEPEDLSRALNEYLSEMTRIAERHGGTLDKFVGDTVIVFFGAPDLMAPRDQALNAVRMALEMLDRTRLLRDRWLQEGFDEPLRVRMGINTGMATVGNLGSQQRIDYTAIGRQVNLASQINFHCDPDSVLISLSTWTLVRDEIPCEPKGEIQVTGLHQSVRVFEVVPPPSLDKTGSREEDDRAVLRLPTGEPGP